MPKSIPENAPKKSNEAYRTRLCSAPARTKDTLDRTKNKVIKKNKKTSPVAARQRIHGTNNQGVAARQRAPTPRSI